MDENDKALLINLICIEQTLMLKESNESYLSQRYLWLEKLKVLLKDET